MEQIKLNMRRALCAFSLLSVWTSTALRAQSWQWAEAGEGAASAYGLAVASDAQGRSVVAGTYNGTIGFAGQLLSSPGEDGIFMAKFDTDGTLLWLHIVANGPGITV